MSRRKETGWLVEVLTFLLPFFFWSPPVRFELAKVSLFLFFGFFLTILFMKEIRRGRIENFFQKIDWLYFSWLTVLLASTLINGSYRHLLAGGYRHQGVIFFFLLGVLALMVRRLNLKESRSIFKLASLAVVIQSLIVYCQWFLIRLGEPVLALNQRPVGTLGEPNALAGFLVLGLPLVSSQLPLLLLSAGAIALVGSKAAVIALLAELAALFSLKREGRQRGVLLIISLFCLILIGVIGVYQERKESVFENRWQIWRLAVEAIKKRPVFGYGAEGAARAYDQEYRRINQPLEGVIIDRGHNIFLDIALSSGLLGLTLFLFWFGRLIEKATKEQRGRLIPLVGFLIFSFFQPVGVTHWFYLMVLTFSPYPLITAKGESSIKAATRSS